MHQTKKGNQWYHRCAEATGYGLEGLDPGTDEKGGAKGAAASALEPTAAPATCSEVDQMARPVTLA